MQQTMLALGALLILVTLTLNQQRSAFLVQKNAYLREMESATADFAEKRFHEVTAGLAFDNARVGMTILDTGTDDLTTEANFGPDPGDTGIDDIDDLHAVVDTTAHMLNNETFEIKATYSVRYVDPDNGTHSSTPTLAKEFYIEAIALDAIGEARAEYHFRKVVAITDYIN
jgi:hypothetical protein